MSYNYTNNTTLNRILDEELAGESYEKINTRWKQTVANAVDLPQEMESYLEIQGGSKNNLKPIGLFVGRDELVKAQDETYFDCEESSAMNEKKCSTVVESFWYYCRYVPVDDSYTPPRRPVPREILRPTTARILRESAIPLPDSIEGDFGELEQYVKNRFDQRFKQTRSKEVHDLLKQAP